VESAGSCGISTIKKVERVPEHSRECAVTGDRRGRCCR
jgi:hypothetical protein